MDEKTVKKFRGLKRRSSIYMIFDGANFVKLKNKKDKVLLPQEKINLSLSSSKSCSNSSLTKGNNNLIENNESKNNLIFNDIHKFRNIKYNGHRYRENKLPVLTNSEILIKEIKNMNLKDNYYKRFVSETNFGQKYAIHNPAYEDFSKYNKEENLIKLGLNNEEKNPIDLIDKNRKKNYSNKNINKYNLGLETFDYQLFKLKKNIKNQNYHKSKSINKLITYKKNNNIISSPYKIIKESPIIKKNEFSNYLILEFIKKNYPSIIKSIDNFDTNKKHKNVLKYLGKHLEARIIYVIKDSTVISNPRFIPGVLVEIPTINGLKKLKNKQRLDLIKRFLDFINIKLRPQLNFNFIFDKNGNNILDFSNLPEKDLYIFVSPINLFQGISFSLHKGIIELYLKIFGKNKKDEFFFDESSFDETSKIFENKYLKDFSENDDIYDLFFSKKFDNDKKYFKKRKKSKILKNSFTFGIDDKYDEEYLYYSDNDKNKKKIFNKISKNCQTRIDFYLEIKNSIYNKKLKELELKLSENKNKKFDNDKFSDNEELREKYLIKRKIKVSDKLGDINENKPLKNHDIVDTFNLLKSFDSSMDIKKFYKHKNRINNFPIIERNIKSNIDKYYFNRKKTNLEYPSLLNYNIPKILKTNSKYSLNNLIKYYTKFKSLINLWYNIHNNIDNAQFGIDFETFYYCTEELCKEEKELAKRIYEKMNNSPSGFLSLEDFINVLNSMNQNDLVRQFYFFLKVFGNIGKKYLSYKDVLQISLISIKRLAKIRKTKQDEKVIRDLGNFFANYLFKICEANLKDGIEIKKLRELLNTQGEKLEYLKLFLLFNDEKHKDKILKVLKEFKHTIK